MKSALLSTSMRFVLLALAVGCGGDPEVVVPDVLRIIALLPSHGAIDVGPATEGLVYFSHDVATPEHLGERIALECLGGGDCASPAAGACAAARVDTAVVYVEENHLARVTHSTPLQDATCYALAVTGGIAASDAAVADLPKTVRSSFKTR